VKPPAANAMFPTNVPATNERATVMGQSTVQLLRAGSYRYNAPVVQGAETNGLPPPHTYNLPPLAPAAGTFVACGRSAAAPQVFVPMW
jgi:hypothetical protein